MCDEDVDLLPPRQALTWKVSNTAVRNLAQEGLDNYEGIVYLECANCNPYSGDTDTDECHPLYCHNPASLPLPTWATSYVNPSTSSGGSSVGTWSGGEVAFTRPIRGRALTSLQVANQICENTFGPGFRMGAFHDGAWKHWGQLFDVAQATNLPDHVWIYIRDKQSNPWN